MYVCVLSRTVGFKPAYKTKLSEFLRKIPIITLLHLSHLVTTAWDKNPGLGMSRVHFPHMVALVN